MYIHIHTHSEGQVEEREEDPEPLIKRIVPVVSSCLLVGLPHGTLCSLGLAHRDTG